MIDLAQTLRTVVAALERSGIDYVLVGSTAAAAWGVARATRDVDIVVVAEADRLDGLLVALQESGLYVPFDEARNAAGTGSSFNVLDPARGGKVDVFVVGPGDEFTRSRLDRRIRVDVFDVAVWVASPEDVIVAKLRWRRTSRSEVQWRDCVEIAATNDLDVVYLRRWAEQFDVADDLDDLLGAIGEARDDD